MRFGLNFFPTVDPDKVTGAEYYESCLRISEEADRLGYSSIKIVEHYFTAYGGYSPDPLTFLAAAAQRTRRIRLVTGAVVPAFNHPLKIAAKTAMVDNLSNGRLSVGFARAFLPQEFDAFGISMDESRERIEEGVEAVRRLWTEEDVVFDGPFHTFGPVTMLPRPVQQPHPPIFIACTQTPASFEWAGSSGFNIMVVPYAGSHEKLQELIALYRRSWAEAGHEPGTEQIQMTMHCYLSEDSAEAKRQAERFYDDYNQKLIDVVSTYQTDHDSPQYAGYSRMIDALKSKRFSDLIDQAMVFVGDPNEVVEQVRVIRDLYGDVEPGLQVNFSSIPIEDSLRTLRLMADEVMPHVSDEPAELAGNPAAR